MDEINLKDILLVLYKKKWLIAAITLLTVSASAVYAFYIKEPLYEAESMIHLRVQPVIYEAQSDTILRLQPPEAGEGLMDLVESIARQTTHDLETYSTQVTNRGVLEKVIEELDLEYTPEALGSMIEMEKIEKTNLIAISFAHSDPDVAAAVANSLTEHFLNFISEKRVEEITLSTAYILQEKEMSEEALQSSLTKLKEFLQQPQGIAELKAEIDAKLSQLTEYKSRIIETDIILQGHLAEKEALTKDMKSTAGRTASGYLAERSVEVNMQIARARSDIASLEKAIALLESELETLQGGYAGKQITYDELQRQVEIHKAINNALADRYAAAQIAGSDQAGRLTMSVFSPAYAPSIPSSPNKKMILAVGGVVGVMFSMLFVLFMQYWQLNNKEKIAL